jgi:hypothetical protein
MHLMKRETNQRRRNLIKMKKRKCEKATKSQNWKNGQNQEAI